MVLPQVENRQAPSYRKVAGLLCPRRLLPRRRRLRTHYDPSLPQLMSAKQILPPNQTEVSEAR